jgi:hypothetical protein
MKVPANVSAGRLIQEYLSRVAEVGLHYLPKGDRAAFVTKTRDRIEREVGPAEEADLARVRQLLTSLGEPEELVKRERARIDKARLKRRSGGNPGNAEVTAPLVYRPINSRWKPATQARPPQQPAPEGQPEAGAGSPAGRPGAGRRGRPMGRVGARLTGKPPGTRRRPPDAAGPAGQEPPGTEAPQAPPPPAPAAVPAAVPEPGVGGIPAQRRAMLMLRSGAGRLSRGAAQLSREAVELTRSHPLEGAAIALLGIGGLIFPFPFWLFGGVLAIWSRIWDNRDKWIALLGPAVITLAGTVVTAVITHHRGNTFVTYGHALRMDVGLLLRVGSVVCATYLAWRVRRGPREVVPPWKR